MKVVVVNGGGEEIYDGVTNAEEQAIMQELARWVETISNDLYCFCF